MTAAVLILAVGVLFMLAGAVPVAGGMQTVVFRTPAFVSLCVALCLSLAVCVLQRGVLRRRVAFTLVHVGPLLILVGAGLGFVRGVRTHVRLFLVPDYVVRELQLQDGSTVDPGFGISLHQFRVEHYEPDYDRFVIQESGDGTGSEYVHAGRYSPTPAGTVEVPGVGGSEALRRHGDDGTEDWVRQYVMPDNSILQMAPRTVKHYEGVLRIEQDGVASEHRLAVNHPVCVQGWRMYLMNEGAEPHQFVDLQVRRDPGRGAVIAGIWILIAGTAGLCFRKGGANAVS